MKIRIHNHVHTGDAEKGNAGKLVGTLKHPGMNVSRGESGYWDIHSTKTGEKVYETATKKAAHGVATSFTEARVTKIVPASGNLVDVYMTKPGSSFETVFRMDRSRAEALQRHKGTGDVKSIWINRQTYPSSKPKFAVGVTVRVKGFKNVEGRSPVPDDKTGIVRAIGMSNGQYTYTIQRSDGIEMTVPQHKVY